MRWIRKQNEPRQLTKWRSQCQNDTNFGYDLLRKDSTTTAAIHSSLLKEQGWICAYTGLRIEANSSHIEHVKPQQHCQAVETVTYINLVACYPAPNPSQKTPYGAEQKGNWPFPAETHLFVSPLNRACETRFTYTLRGKIEARDGDLAAKTTIAKLALDHPTLEAYRQAAIQGVLGKENNLSLKAAKQRLKQIKEATSGKLDPFCFVLAQALEKHIKRIEAIHTQKHTQSQAKQSKK